jgi:hypothetical protein
MRRPLLPYTGRKAPRRRSAGDPQLFRAVSAHVERHIGRIEWVIPDPVSDVVRIDLLCVRPAPGREFYTFVTCGMAERAMTAPDGWRGCCYAELVLRLPRTWPITASALEQPRNRWPLTELRNVARLPHLRRTWLWAYHTVSNMDPPEPLCSSTRFCGSILAHAEWPSPSFGSLLVKPRRSIHVLSLIPLFTDELLFAREAGSAALLDRFANAGVTDLLDDKRPIRV